MTINFDEEQNCLVEIKIANLAFSDSITDFNIIILIPLMYSFELEVIKEKKKFPGKREFPHN